MNPFDGLSFVCVGLDSPLPVTPPKRRILGIDPGLHNFGLVLMEEDMFSHRLSLALSMANLASQVSRDSAKHLEIPMYSDADDCSWYAKLEQPVQGEGRDRKATHNIPQDMSSMFNRLLQRAKPSRLVKNIVPNSTFGKTTADVVREGFAALEPQARQMERELAIRDALQDASSKLFKSDVEVLAELEAKVGGPFTIVVGDLKVLGSIGLAAYSILDTPSGKGLMVDTATWHDVLRFGPVPEEGAMVETHRRLYQIIFGERPFAPWVDPNTVMANLSERLRTYAEHEEGTSLGNVHDLIQIMAETTQTGRNETMAFYVHPTESTNVAPLDPNAVMANLSERLRHCSESDGVAGSFTNAHLRKTLNDQPLFDFSTGQFQEGVYWSHASNLGKSGPSDFLVNAMPVPKGRDENEWRAEVRYRIATGQTDMTKPMVMYDYESTLNPESLLAIFETYVSGIDPKKDAAE
jgi:hypothetical protein